ncbi:hypothetical protein LDJ79_22940 [Vibrio tritonius]|uniref:Uncharacterized protein n=1 Tax=Vibrio tritonius TaxID=1435069 RepID=A0ABS7YUD6_9VIBR|nr:hypothetical protein [Vibrio tritonius]MCA2018988.1 hypothetical protein [Vibrio tritonius]
MTQSQCGQTYNDLALEPVVAHKVLGCGALCVDEQIEHLPLPTCGHSAIDSVVMTYCS